MNRLCLEDNDVFVHSDTTIFGEVRLGRYTIVERKSFVVGVSPLEVGAFCVLGEGFHCHTHEQHRTYLPSTYIWPDVFDLPWGRGGSLDGLDEAGKPVVPAPVRIGNDVHFGRSVSVSGGVTIGDGCIFRDGCLVTKDCEPYGVYEGVPARRVGERCSAKVAQDLVALQWWEWPLDRIQRNAEFFSLSLSEACGLDINRICL
jgi:virginiamycin A acetyltransferase